MANIVWDTKLPELTEPTKAEILPAVGDDSPELRKQRAGFHKKNITVKVKSGRMVQTSRWVRDTADSKAEHEVRHEPTSKFGSIVRKAVDDIPFKTPHFRNAVVVSDDVKFKNMVNTVLSKSGYSGRLDEDAKIAGIWDPVSKNIYINESDIQEAFGVNAELAVGHITRHEMGHSLELTLLRGHAEIYDNWIDVWKLDMKDGQITDVAIEDPGEGFAEAFAFYFSGSEAVLKGLGKRSEHIIEFMDKLVEVLHAEA